MERKPDGYWNYDRCYEVALKCKNQSEMRATEGGAECAAARKGWIKDYYWFEHKQKPKNYWNYDTCFEVALKCKSRSEMGYKYPQAYNISRKNNWLDDYDWFEKDINPYSNGRDNVYAYFFNDNHAVYIGRTINPRNRDWSHHRNGSVYNFSIENNVEIPTIVILESGLTVYEGLEKEDYYVNKYKSEGWNIINKAKTGKESGSIGSIHQTYTYNKCLEIAKTCTSIKEFKEKNVSAYCRAWKMGWLKDYTWFIELQKPTGYWDYDTCYKCASECKNRTDFKTKYPSAYRKAIDKGWIDDYTWFESKKTRNNELTYEYCFNIAKTCKTRGELQKKYQSVYAKAMRKKWIDDYYWIPKSVFDTKKAA